MIFSIDRIQYSVLQDRYYIFEFLEIPNVNSLLNSNGTITYTGAMGFEGFWDRLREMISDIGKQKLELIRNLDANTTKIFIIYQRGINAYLKIEEGNNHFDCDIYRFNELQKWFRKMNNIDGHSYSKKLGNARDSNEDKYINSLLCSLYDDSSFKDDNGLELTKYLLNGDTTRGFDFDLFQKVSSTNEYIIYEFLKRDNPYINNIQAHPMRYCWTGSKRDNKQKYISLWKVKKFFNAKLLLINYSDDSTENLSIIEVLDFDEQKGIIEENQFCMSRSNFLDLLKQMESYQERHNNYFADYFHVHHDEDYFSNFSSNKKYYGIEFRN